MKKHILFSIVIVFTLLLVPLNSSMAATIHIMPSGAWIGTSYSTATSAVSISAISDTDTNTRIEVFNVRDGRNTLKIDLGDSFHLTRLNYGLLSNTIGDVVLRFYDQNNNQITSSTVTIQYSNNINLDVPGARYFTLTSLHPNGSFFFHTLKLYGEGNITYDEITNLEHTETHNSVELNFEVPNNNLDFVGTKIYKDGELIKSLDSNQRYFNDLDVIPETKYVYKVTAVYSDGYETEGLTREIQTSSPPPPDRDGDGIPDSEDEYPEDPTNTPPPQPVGEVKSLEITTTYKSANLSWVLPKNENLQHVNIYRDTLTEETSFMEKLINVKKAYAASEKIFETNGTYFNDYTVKPSTEYEYTVTTTSVDGVESEGVTATTKTPGKPAITFEEMSLPFSVKDLLLSGNGLLWMVGPFILLALAFLLVPKLRNLIFGTFRKGSKRSSEASERRTKAEAIQKMESREAKEIKTSRETKSDRLEVTPKPIREPKELKQPRIREPKERMRTPKLSRERIREPRAPRASREPREPRERTRKPRDRRGIS